MEVKGGNVAVEQNFELSGLDAWVFSRPMTGHDSGGDVHYLSSCATGRVARVLLADVAGHGEVVSSVSGNLQHLMRRFVNFIDQSRFVATLNQSFYEQESGGLFATALIMSWFGPTGELCVCNAGHPSPFIYQSSGSAWGLLESEAEVGQEGLRNVPLGVAQGVTYDKVVRRLGPDDLVFCYSDALIECLGDGSGSRGQAFLLQWFQECSLHEPEDLLAAVKKLLEGRDVGDDLTLLLLRPGAVQPWNHFRRKVMAPFRVVAASIRAALSGGSVPWPEMTLANIGGSLLPFLNKKRKL